MSATEKYGSFHIEETRQGCTAERVIICDWSERATYAPKIGDPWPGNTALRVTRVAIDGLGKPSTPTPHVTWTEGEYGFTKAQITVGYSTAPYIENAPIWSWEYSGEVLETGLGRTWASTGKPCESMAGVYFPTATIRAQYITSAVPQAAIIACLNKVNAATWFDFPAEQLLFEGAATDPRFDYDRDIYFYTITYSFLFRTVSHNVVWRAPKQALNLDNTPMVDAEGYPVYLSGTAGTGAWDRPNPDLYGSADFNALFPPGIF